MTSTRAKAVVNPTENPLEARSPASSGPSIVFATIAAGGSHVSTAHAMSEAVQRNSAGPVSTSVREPMLDYGFTTLDRRHKEGWKRALERPSTIVLGQVLIDAFPRPTAAFHRWLLRSFAERAAVELEEERPDLVVVNHGWLAVALTLAQRRFGLSVPVVTFETSTVNANALWAEPRAERFVVASAESRRRLQRFGIPGSRIDVVGYPVRRAFLCAPAKGPARAVLGLDDAFTCLVALGGEGVGGMPERVVDALLAERDVQVLVVTGRNSELRARLELQARCNPRLRVLGFVEDMATCVAASDVVIAKSGPATVYECLAVGRPVLVPSRFGSAENRMTGLLERHGLGGYVPRLERLRAAVRSYRDAPGRLDEIRERSRVLDFKGMADRLGRYLLHYSRTRRPDRDACGPGIPMSPNRS